MSINGCFLSFRCYLEPHRGFIWAFIAPVILIFLANICFFIMAVDIMWKHQQKRKEISKISNMKHLLKHALLLTVIMGLTWIFGLLIIEEPNLLPFVYVFSILVAFQGTFIFILFVLLSKSVRDTIIKQWKVQVNQSQFLRKYFGEKLTSTNQVRNVYFTISVIGKSTMHYNDIMVLERVQYAFFFTLLEQIQ